MQAIHIYLLQHHINWSTSFNLWPVTMFSHFVACCVYGSACANCVSRLSSIGDQEFTWTYPWETGIAELRLFGVLFFVVSPWTVTCYLQKWDPSPDRKSKALKNDAALLRRVERSLVLNGERDVGMGFCETQAVSTWPEVLSNLIIVRVLVKNCLTAVQAWVIQFNNFMQKLWLHFSRHSWCCSSQDGHRWVSWTAGVCPRMHAMLIAGFMGRTRNHPQLKSMETGHAHLMDDGWWCFHDWWLIWGQDKSKGDHELILNLVVWWFLQILQWPWTARF